MARASLPRLLLVGLTLLVLHALAAVPASAEGSESPTALEQLTDAERRVLDKRVRGFADMPPRQQERIAANVIRLRGLEGEERARFLERVRALERHRDEDGRLPSSLNHARHPQLRKLIRRRGTKVRGVGHRMWASLSPYARSRIKAQLGRRGRGLVEVAFARRLAAAEARAIAATDGAIELPSPLPAPLGRLVQQLEAQAADGDAKARLKLAQLALVFRPSSLLEGVPDTGSVDSSVLRRIGERAEARAPVAFKAQVAALERAAQDGRTLERYARAGGRSRRPGARPAAQDPKLKRLVKALVEAGPSLEADPRLRGPAERLERALRKAMGANDAAGRTPPDREDRDDREERGR